MLPRKKQEVAFLVTYLIRHVRIPSSEFVCNIVADVAFIVDSSGSIGIRNWEKMLDFIKEMVCLLYTSDAADE